MAELILEPYAVRQRWRLHGGGAEWESLIGDYLEMVAHSCAETGTTVVGHIKALALFPNGGYLRVSVVSPDRPAQTEGGVPADCRELVLDVNVIVYGLERGRLERVTRDAAARVTEGRRGTVTIEML